jgi:hypothetical protein
MTRSTMLMGACALLFLTVLVHAQPAVRRGELARAHRMAEAAGLDEAGTARLITLVEGAQREFEALAQRDATEKRELAEQVAAGTGEDARATALVDHILGNESQAAAINLRLMQRCRGLMSPAQFARLVVAGAASNAAPTR